MKETGTRRGGYIPDPSTGQPARSVIDEKQLQSISDQLRLPYLHRTVEDGGTGVVAAVRLKELSSLSTSDGSRSVEGRTELYWLFLLALAAVAAWELGASLAAATALRDREAASAPAAARKRTAPGKPRGLQPAGAWPGPPPGGARTGGKGT